MAGDHLVFKCTWLSPVCKTQIIISSIRALISKSQSEILQQFMVWNQSIWQSKYSWLYHHLLTCIIDSISEQLYWTVNLIVWLYAGYSWEDNMASCLNIPPKPIHWTLWCLCQSQLSEKLEKPKAKGLVSLETDLRALDKLGALPYYINLC